MPYIPQDQRAKLAVSLPLGVNAGQLNFIISDLVDQWIGLTPNYYQINDAIGVLECAKLELYRKLAAPYEDRKCESNGEVYMERG